MDKNGNTYTFIYASVMVIIVAAVLSFAATTLKPLQTKNIKIEKKQNILSSVKIESTAADAEAKYDEMIIASYIVNSKGQKVDGDAFAVNLKKERSKPVEEQLLPVFEAKLKDGKKYIIPMYGAGLWGPIWGYVSLNEDLTTLYGAIFDHSGETPGLGAEISTAKFQAPFTGKKIFTNGQFTPIVIAKSGEKAPEAQRVDAISGGTITSKGLQDMMSDDLSSYVSFLKNNMPN